MHWSGPHLHILLNHFPSVGTVIALGLFLAAWYLKSEDLKRSSLVLFVLLALIAVPTYVTGATARWALRRTPDISADMIAAHMDAALLAFIVLGLMGMFAWVALWQARRYAQPPQWPVYTAALLAVVALLIMVQVGNLGGQINHPEIQTGIVTGVEGEGRTAAVEGFIRDYGWSWPALEAAHFMGMAVLFGVVLLTSVRVLGFGKNSVAFPPLHRLLPLGAFGVFINIVTGMAFFIADSGRYTAMDGFPPKMTLLMIGSVAMLYFTIFDEPWKLRAGDDAPLRTKIMAGITLAAWVGVIAFGRLLPYFGEGPGG
jgi:uncharacterized membrane protein